MGKVVVYDDDENAADARSERIKALLARLTREGIFESEPSVVTATLRPEVLEALADNEPAILIADLMSADWGSPPKGARILRAVSSHADARSRTWRIALTMRSSPAVARDLDDIAHAMVVYRDTATQPLGDAITEIVSRSPDDVGEMVVQPPDAMERHSAERTRYLKVMLGDDYTKELEDAVFRWIESPFAEMPLAHPSGHPFFHIPERKGRRSGTAAGAPADTGRGSDSDGAVTVTKLQDHLRKRGRLVSTQHLRTQLERCLLPLSDSGLRQPVVPEAIQIALQPDVSARLRDYSDIVGELWLKQSEYRVANKFLQAALNVDRNFATLPTDRIRSYDKVNQAYEDPDYLETLEATRLDHWDTCYAIWTIVDWALDAGALESKRALAC